MLSDVILSAASFLLSEKDSGTVQFFEQKIHLSSGIQTIETSDAWNGITLIPTNDISSVMFYTHPQTKKKIPWLPDNHSKNFEVFFDRTTKSFEIFSSQSTEFVAKFYNTKKIAEERLVASFQPFKTDNGDDIDLKQFNPMHIPKFISRKEWGASESLRISQFPTITDLFRTAVPESRWATPQESSYIFKQFDDSGNRLTWPIEKNRVFKKIIIHHTGEYVDNLRDPKEIMRSIYASHTLGRGWGDIGYHYVIDREGNIYEGRAGGPEVVGAHTWEYNLGTIGISLMGNFNREKPSAAQLEILPILLAHKAYQHNIDPIKQSDFLKIKSYNIDTHRHVTRPGHATSCPGENLDRLMPSIRHETSKLIDIFAGIESGGRYFLRSPEAIQAKKIADEKKSAKKILNLPYYEMDDFLDNIIIQKNSHEKTSFRIKNNTQNTWPIGSQFVLQGLPLNMKASLFTTEIIYPHSSGNVAVNISTENVKNGIYTPTLGAKFQIPPQSNRYIPRISVPIKVSGNQDFLFAPINLLTSKHTKSSLKHSSIFAPNYLSRIPHTNQETKTLTKKTPPPSVIKKTFPKIQTSIMHQQKNDLVNIRLSFFTESQAVISSNRPINILNGNFKIMTIPAREKITLQYNKKKEKFHLTHRGKMKKFSGFLQFQSPNGILTIHNYNRGLSLPYNAFRDSLVMHSSETSDNGFIIVNRLPVESYLWGLGELPSTEPTEKRKAITILARSYAYAYMGKRRKFNTEEYDLEDSAATSQRYLGFLWEKHNPSHRQIVDDTQDLVITYNNKVVVGPYFSQSDGMSSGRWRTTYPWTYARKIPYDEGREPRGHQVGLSGSAAKDLAHEGENFREILDYFYRGIEIQKI